MREVLACLLILAMLPAITVAGQSGLASQKEGESELWRIRSQALTDDLLKDAGQLGPMRRAVLLARLAHRWGTDDKERARKWFQNAIELVEPTPNKETADEHRERMAAARTVLKNVARFDQSLALRVVKILTPDKQTSKDESSENAEWLMNSATDMIAVDIDRASELARFALRIGPPNDVASFLVALRAKDPKRADTMFAQALLMAKQQPFPVQLLNTLAYAAFPLERGYGRNIPIPSENLRSEFLQTEIEFLNANQINDDNRGSMCACVSGFIAPMLSEFDRLLQTQAEVVRQAMNKCDSVAPMIRQQLDDSMRPLNTTEDFLKAAADAKHEGVATTYKFRAANLAMGAKNYDLAIRILNDMRKEEREFMGDAWDSYRWDWAAQGAIDYYQHNRIGEMNALLNAVPDNLRPFGKIAFIDRVREQKDSDPAPLVQILNEALIELRRSTVPDFDKYNWYMALIRSTVKYQPSEASGILKAAVSSLNKAKDSKTLETAEFSDQIAEPLLAMDEYVVKDSIAAITFVETRANLRLVLLGATLRHMKS